jgi:hypothetical protein
MKVQSDVQKQDDWFGVPDDYQTAWQQIYQESRESLNLPVPCPICNVMALHRWYQIGHPVDRIIDGRRFIATGAVWEWCSSCQSFDHYSGLVPDYWSCNLVVDEKKLTALPTAIQSAMEAQDQGLNRPLT